VGLKSKRLESAVEQVLIRESVTQTELHIRLENEVDQKRGKQLRIKLEKHLEEMTQLALRIMGMVHIIIQAIRKIQAQDIQQKDMIIIIFPKGNSSVIDPKFF
jgi:hypothetical protein